MKQEKVTFIHSISAKITLLAVFIVVVSLVGSVINASSKSRKVVENVNRKFKLYSESCRDGSTDDREYSGRYCNR